MKNILLILLAAISISCIIQEKKTNTSGNADHQKIVTEAAQIGQYVINVFEDSKRNLWFGTIEKGVAKYDGKLLTYFTSTGGLPANFVGPITEDKNGNLWFGTSSGLSKYDEKSFTNFTVNDGLCHNRVSNLLIDSKGMLWIGTWGGVCRYDGNKFSDLDIPIIADSKIS